jgi:hypothetical protein
LSAPELCNTAHRLGGAGPACTLQVTLRVARPQLMPVALWVVIVVQASWLSSLRINTVKPAQSAVCSMPVLAYPSSCIAQNILKRISAECKHLAIRASITTSVLLQSVAAAQRPRVSQTMTSSTSQQTCHCIHIVLHHKSPVQPSTQKRASF